MAVARKMVDFTFSVRYEELPPEVILAAKRQLADSMGGTLGASDLDTANNVNEPVEVCCVE